MSGSHVAWFVRATHRYIRVCAGVYGNMAYCDVAGVRSRHLSFCSDSSSLMFYQRTSHIYLYSHGGIKRGRIDGFWSASSTVLFAQRNSRTIDRGKVIGK